LEHFFYFWFGPVEHPFELVATSFYTLLGLAGLRLMRRRVGNTQFYVWCTVFATYPLMYYLIQYVNRYRVPIEWMIWLSAGLAITTVLERLFPDRTDGRNPRA
jgi:hypothetical protein